MEMRLDGPQMAVFIDFENVATSAESTLGDLDVNAIMNLLRSRGRLLIKRAYGDWGRFHHYRRAMLENGIDLFQLYSFGIQHKNRADVRLAIDALETVFTRPNIDVYAIVSGDSDFTELIHKLRDHGKYTIGIGLHAATSDLLRRACDEFIFYETLVAEELADIADELQLPDPRELLRWALQAAEQKGESPVFAGRLKQIMLGLDSSFNEANYGFDQFRTFLEANQDLIVIQEQGMQLYISLRHQPQSAQRLAEQPVIEEARTSTLPEALPPQFAKPAADPGQRYRNFLREAGLRVVESGTRRQMLADFLAVIRAEDFGEHGRAGEPITLNAAADLLRDRYDAENALTAKMAVPDVMRLLIMSDGLTFAGGQPGGNAPLVHTQALTVDTLTQACEAVYVWRLIEGGMPIQPEQVAAVLHGAGADPSTVSVICERLIQSGMIVTTGDTYVVSPVQINKLMQREVLLPVTSHIEKEALPTGEPVTLTTAESLFREASELRQKDFAGSARRYLQAARIQLEALKSGDPKAGFDNLRWYIASFCSVKAGHAFVTGNYAEAMPFYLVFFSLAQEADSIWPRIQRLVHPMASYFFAIVGKQANQPVPPNLGRSPAAQVALRMHNHDVAQVSQAWEELMRRLAAVNLGLIRQTCRDLTGLLGPTTPVGSENVAPLEHTRAFLAGLIAEKESLWTSH